MGSLRITNVMTFNKLRNIKQKKKKKKNATENKQATDSLR